MDQIGQVRPNENEGHQCQDEVTEEGDEMVLHHLEEKPYRRDPDQDC